MTTESKINLRAQSTLRPNKKSRPVVTFALFTYNQERYIREAIEGALSQTYSPLEIILSDDCSTDRTFHIMSDMVRDYKGPHNLRVRRQSFNDGLLNHVCAVIAEMRGEIMVLAAGDDISAPKRVETLIAGWTPECVGMYSACNLIDDEGATVQSNWLPASDARKRLPWLQNLHTDLFVYGASSSYHRSILDKLPRSNSRVFSEDTPLNLLIQFSAGEVQCRPEPLVKYRIHRNTISSTGLSTRPSFREIKRVESGRARQLTIQRDILVYLKDVLVPEANAQDSIDLLSMKNEIAFCDLRLNWYAGSIAERARLSLKMTTQSSHWILPRLLGLNFYVFLKYLLTNLRLGKSHSIELKP